MLSSTPNIDSGKDHKHYQKSEPVSYYREREIYFFYFENSKFLKNVYF